MIKNPPSAGFLLPAIYDGNLSGASLREVKPVLSAALGVGAGAVPCPRNASRPRPLLPVSAADNRNCTLGATRAIAWWVTRRATLAVPGRSALSAANPLYGEPIILDVSAA